MLFYLISFLCSFLLGTLLVLTDFFPVHSLMLQNILVYLSFQSAMFLQFDIERQLFGYVCLYAACIFSIAVILPLPFPERDRKIARIACATILCVISAVKAEKTFNLGQYFQARLQSTALYDTDYKDAQLVSAPAQPKKNLIVIFLESIENSYSSSKLFGKNLIPHLSNLNGKKVARYQELIGLDNTSSALIGAFCGLPYLPALKEMDRNSFSFTFSKNTCLTDILHDAGYENFFYTATDTTFAHKDYLLNAHHFRHIEDAKTLRTSAADNGLSMFNAVKDSVLLDAALNGIKNAEKSGQPFAFFILTLNTHEPSGFLEKQCDLKSDVSFKDVVFCLDNQMKDFIGKLKKLPSYKDTVVVLVGDHTARKNVLYDSLEKIPNRTIYNNFTNGADALSNLDRTFTALDIGPTVLELLGFELQDGALGLGRSLLRPEPTVIEKYGKRVLEQELLKKSKKYREFLRK